MLHTHPQVELIDPTNLSPDQATLLFEFFSSHEVVTDKNEIYTVFHPDTEYQFPKDAHSDNAATSIKFIGKNKIIREKKVTYPDKFSEFFNINKKVTFTYRVFDEDPTNEDVFVGHGAFAWVYRIAGTLKKAKDENIIQFHPNVTAKAPKVIKVNKFASGDFERVAELKTENKIARLFKPLKVKKVTIDNREIEEKLGVQWKRAYFVERELPGYNLSEILKVAHCLTIEQRRILSLNLIAGLLELYEKYGIVHRDIKPDNIRVNNKFEITYTDFNLSRLKGKPDYESGGSPAYMAPEIIASNGKDGSGKSDFYSLGLILRELWEDDASIHFAHYAKQFPAMPLVGIVRKFNNNKIEQVKKQENIPVNFPESVLSQFNEIKDSKIREKQIKNLKTALEELTSINPMKRSLHNALAVFKHKNFKPVSFIKRHPWIKDVCIGALIGLGVAAFTLLTVYSLGALPLVVGTVGAALGIGGGMVAALPVFAGLLSAATATIFSGIAALVGKITRKTNTPDYELYKMKKIVKQKNLQPSPDDNSNDHSENIEKWQHFIWLEKLKETKKINKQPKKVNNIVSPKIDKQKSRGGLLDSSLKDGKFSNEENLSSASTTTNYFTKNGNRFKFMCPAVKPSSSEESIVSDPEASSSLSNSSGSSLK